MSDALSSSEAKIIDVHMQNFKTELTRQGDTMHDISQSLKVLSRLEQSHSHIMDQLKNGSITMTGHEKRIAQLENKMPALIETRKWVVSGVLAGVGMMGLALAQMVLVEPGKKAPQVIYVQPPAALPPEIKR